MINFGLNKSPRTSAPKSFDFQLFMFKKVDRYKKQTGDDGGDDPHPCVAHPQDDQSGVKVQDGQVLQHVQDVQDNQDGQDIQDEDDQDEDDQDDQDYQDDQDIQDDQDD